MYVCMSPVGNANLSDLSQRKIESEEELMSLHQLIVNLSNFVFIVNHHSRREALWSIKETAIADDKWCVRALGGAKVSVCIRSCVNLFTGRLRSSALSMFWFWPVYRIINLDKNGVGKRRIPCRAFGKRSSEIYSFSGLAFDGRWLLFLLLRSKLTALEKAKPNIVIDCS